MCKYRYVVAYDANMETWAEVAAIKRDDRVYAVAVNGGGDLVAVAGRDKVCAIYAIEREDSGPGHAAVVRRLCVAVRPAFLYSVALTSDGKKCAVGGVDNALVVFDVSVEYGTMTPAHVLRLHGVVSALAFSHDGRHLAAGTEDKKAAVWRLPLEKDAEQEDHATSDRIESSSKELQLEPVLMLPRATSVSSVAFSDEMFCFSSGSLATLYGRGGRSCAWTDRPAFAVLTSLLENASGGGGSGGASPSRDGGVEVNAPLDVALMRHPTLANTVNPHSGESALAFVARKKRAVVVEQMLKVPCVVGLMSDPMGGTAISAVLRRDAKPALRALLKSLTTLDMASQPHALAPVLQHRAVLSARYPGG